MEWRWKRYRDLSLDELYELLRLRELVFVVEQRILYVDCDGHDRDAWHLLGYRDGEPVAYLRAFEPGVRGPEASFGRVLTAPSARGGGVGRELTRQALARMRAEFGPCEVKISAQSYLLRFYERMGFVRQGEEYLEVGVPHVKMITRLTG